MALVLRKVSGIAWREAFRLMLHPGQRKFVSTGLSPILVSLLKTSARRKNCLPLAAYLDEGQMVGFLLLTQARASRECWLDHFFIDRHYQGQGYGKEVLARVIELAKVDLSCRYLCLRVSDENSHAQRLYLGIGFENTGKRRGRQLIYRLAINRSVI